MTRRLASCILILILGAGLLSACNSSTPSEPRPTEIHLDLSLAASSVALGERALITLALVNDTDAPHQFLFSTSCQEDLVIESAGAQVWSLSSRSFCLLGITTFTLQPRQSIRYQLSWDQSRNDGGPPQPGTYTVRGILQTAEPLSSEPATLTVRP